MPKKQLKANKPSPYPQINQQSSNCLTYDRNISRHRERSLSPSCIQSAPHSSKYGIQILNAVCMMSDSGAIALWHSYACIYAMSRESGMRSDCFCGEGLAAWGVTASIIFCLSYSFDRGFDGLMEGYGGKEEGKGKNRRTPYRDTWFSKRFRGCRG